MGEEEQLRGYVGQCGGGPGNLNLLLLLKFSIKNLERLREIR